MQRTRFYSSVSHHYFTTKGRLINVAKNEVIISPQEKTGYMYYIESGFVKVYTLSSAGHCNLLLIYGEGEFFPIQPFVDIGLHDELYYETKTSVSLYKVPADQYADALTHSVEFLSDVLTQTRIMVEIYRNTIESLQYRALREQLISKILFLGWRFGSDRSVIEAPITHQDLADYLRTSRESVSRAMKTLRDENLIEQMERRIVIKDRDKLLDEL